MARFLQIFGRSLALVLLLGLFSVFTPIEGPDAFAQGEVEEWVLFPHERPDFKGHKIIVREDAAKFCGNIKVTGLLNKAETRFKSIRVAGDSGRVAAPEEMLKIWPMPAKYSFGYMRAVGCDQGRVDAAIKISFVYDVPPKAVDDPEYYNHGETKTASLTIRDWKITSIRYQIAGPDGDLMWIEKEIS